MSRAPHAASNCSYPQRSSLFCGTSRRPDQSEPLCNGTRGDGQIAPLKLLGTSIYRMRASMRSSRKPTRSACRGRWASVAGEGHGRVRLQRDERARWQRRADRSGGGAAMTGRRFSAAARELARLKRFPSGGGFTLIHPRGTRLEAPGALKHRGPATASGLLLLDARSQRRL